MSDKKNNKTRRPVEAVGNSWIVCQSKSHPGYVYYFNTLTGDAVWNLSNDEIQKAQSITLVQASQSNVDLTKCREPKDNPPSQTIPAPETMNPTNESDTHIQSEGLFQQNAGINLQTQNNLGIYPNVALNNINPLDINSLNSQITPFNVFKSNSVFSSNCWHIPQSQQFFITSSLPLMNQTPASVNIAYNQLVRNDQIPSLGPNNYHNTRKGRSPFAPRNMYGMRGRSYSNVSQYKNTDLRQQLRLKRRWKAASTSKTQLYREDCTRIDGSNESNQYNIRLNKKTADVSSHIADIIEADIKARNPPDLVVDSNTETQKVERTYYDLKPLKHLAPPNAQTIWYIVVDMNILLAEFNFLNDIIESESHCYLMVPQSVMAELKDYIARTNNIPARRIYYAITQQLENGSILIAGKPSQDYDETFTNPILKTCLEFLEDNYHVILITNNSKLLSLKRFIKINTFTADEVKALLENSVCICPSHHRSIAQTALTIKPPFKSNVINKDAELHNETIVKDILRDESVPVLPRSNSKPTSISEHTKTEIPTGPTNIDTTDSGINTQEIPSALTNIDTTDSGVNTQEITSGPTNIDTKDSETNTQNRRAIRLKRSAPYPPTDATSLEKNYAKRPRRLLRKRNLHLDNENSFTCANTETRTDKDLTDDASRYRSRTENVLNSGGTSERTTSSIISVVERKRNITIEETSTSGIISNTDSNVDVRSVDNTREDLADQIEELAFNHSPNKVITFGVDDETMEDSLKTNIEEWVSRFVQVMEEVLATVLHKEERFSNLEMPPPWTLHEAAQCIGKYCRDEGIKSVTDKLSMLIFDLSDSAGKLSKDMTPHQYMEMYSYGVSLLNVVKSISTNCEDIEIAEESLRKLMSDIKNPSYGSNDSVIDQHEDTERSQVTDSIIVLDNEPKTKDMNIDARTTSTPNSPTTYNTRLKARKTLMEDLVNLSKEKKKSCDEKTSFLSTLKLQECTRSPSSVQKSSESQDPANVPVTFSSGGDDNEVINEPIVAIEQNIVRNFSRCQEFEEKLKNKFDCYAFNDNEDCLDYEQDYDLEDCQSDESLMSDEDDELTDPNVTQVMDSSELDIPDSVIASSPKPVDPSLDGDSNKTFRFMTCMFLEEVKKAVNEVKVLCDKCYAELKEPQLSTIEKNKLRNQITEARLHIVGLSLSLQSMQAQDPDAPTNNMLTALKKAGVDLSCIDKDLLTEYWNTIANCKKNADFFLDSIQEIITAFGTNV